MAPNERAYPRPRRHRPVSPGRAAYTRYDIVRWTTMHRFDDVRARHRRSPRPMAQVGRPYPPTFLSRPPRIVEQEPNPSAPPRRARVPTLCFRVDHRLAGDGSTTTVAAPCANHPLAGADLRRTRSLKMYVPDETRSAGSSCVRHIVGVSRHSPPRGEPHPEGGQRVASPWRNESVFASANRRLANGG